MNELSKTAEASDERSRRPAMIAFALFVAGYIAVVWSFHYLPTYDGPAHVGSAVVWAELARPGRRYREFYVLAPKQVPNLTSQLSLGALVRLMPPLVAEKVLVTVYITGVALAFWYFMGAFGRDAAWLAPLGLLFLFNRAFLAGFYNYSLSLIVFWCVAGFAARCAARLSVLETLSLAAALMAAYWTHLVGWLLSVLAAFWFVAARPTERAGNLPRVALAAVPSLLFALLYCVDTSIVGQDGVPTAIGQALRQLSVPMLGQRLAALGDNVFGTLDLPAGGFSWVVLALFQALIGTTALSKDGRGGAIGAAPATALAGALFAGYCVLPDNLGRHGGFLLMRLAFLPPMLLIAALRLPRRAMRRHTVLLLVYSALGVNLTSAICFFRRANAEIDEYVAGMAVVGNNAAIFTASAPGASYWPDHLRHAACYYCLSTGNIALENYQGEPGPFWIQLRDGVARGLGDFGVYPNRALVDFVVVWHDASRPLAAPAGCREVFAQGRLHVFATRRGFDADGGGGDEGRVRNARAVDG